MSTIRVLLHSLKAELYREKFGNCDDIELCQLVHTLSVPSKRNYLLDIHSISKQELPNKISLYFENKIEKLRNPANLVHQISYTLQLNAFNIVVRFWYFEVILRKS